MSPATDTNRATAVSGEPTVNPRASWTTNPPFRFHNTKPPRQEEPFFDAVVIPASVAIAKALVIVAGVVLLIAMFRARHG